jgi:hypothetical protein
MEIEGFDFKGAAVPSRNGAGIRLEKGTLLVRNCVFIGNENGILTGNNQDTRLLIEDSEFGYNGFGDGQSHNLYAGEIAYLSVTGSYFHHAKVGHLLKTRAAVNDIRYNRLTDEQDGGASYELEFAAGGVAYVTGNIIQQSAFTNNPHLISFGAEGYKWSKNELYLTHNTLVDDRTEGGVFLRVRPGASMVQVENNILVGNGKDEPGTAGPTRRNFHAPQQDFIASRRDYRLSQRARLLANAVPLEPVNGADLAPSRQFTLPRGTKQLAATPKLMGAVQTAD